MTQWIINLFSLPIRLLTFDFDLNPDLIHDFVYEELDEDNI